MIKYFFILFPVLSWGQSFAPEPGAVGSTAIHKDSSIIIGWASGVEVTRGPIFIEGPGNGNATYGIDSFGIGPADGLDVVSLGDGGEAIITFDAPITNDVGPDFAIFENGFIDHYLELAFVEVSSDGINYTRFEATSEIQTDIQLTNFDTVNCRYVNNFAGKYKANYGTPFDLDELASTPGLDIDNVTHIKLIDVVGTINPTYGTFDSQGTIINDPYPTMFESGGFDLDAVGVIHSEQLSLSEFELGLEMYPNPTSGLVYIEFNQEFEYQVFDSEGRILIEKTKKSTLDLSPYQEGIYYIEFYSNNTTLVRRIFKY